MQQIKSQVIQFQEQSIFHTPLYYHTVQLITYIFPNNSPMRLDPSYLHFISKQELRILVAIQIGMKNHEFVPLQLISTIGNIRSGETYKITRKLLKVKLVVHVGKKILDNGYKLTYLGYDYLALHTFMKRGIVKDVICKIGVGKESDIYKCSAFDGTPVVLKLTRLGRRSFKTIKNNRQYIQNRTSFNWLYLSRLSAMRQFTFMQILYEDGFPTPRPIDTNRHAIVMSLIDGDPLCNIKKIGQSCSVKKIFLQTLQLVQRFATRGLIHGDFNQFNLLISTQGKLTVIDFPQCISSNHPNAQQYFNRDIECLYTFFDKMLHKCRRQNQQGQINIHEDDKGFYVQSIPMPVLKQIQILKRFDIQVRARGHFKLTEEKELDQFMKEWNLFRANGYKEGEAVVEQDEEDEEEHGQGQAQEGQLADLIEIDNDKNQQKGVAKLSFDQNDEDIKQLINELKQIEKMPNKEEQTVTKKQEGQKEGQKVQNQNVQNQSSQQSQQEQQGTIKMREEWKGLTAFQIRQILKEERKKEREKKKQEMTTQEYIKKALHKKKAQRTSVPRGNYGAKVKAKTKAQTIKDGLEMGW